MGMLPAISPWNHILKYRRAPPLPTSVEYEEEEEEGGSDDAAGVQTGHEPPSSPFVDLPPVQAKPRLSARALSSVMRRSGKGRRNAGDSRGMFPEIQPDDTFTPLSGMCKSLRTSELDLQQRCTVL